MADGDDKDQFPDELNASGVQTKKSKQLSKSRKKKQRFRSRPDPENNADSEEIGSPTTRPRRRSEADKRNRLEKHRKRQQDTTYRDARSNNRFLRAISGQQAVPRPDFKPASPQEMKENDDDDDSDNTTTSKLLPKRDTAPRASSTEGIVVAPGTFHSGWFNSSKRDQCRSPAQKWAEQIKQREAAGLFVDTERRQCMRLEPSTIDRLEERLHRELAPRWKKSASSQHSFALKDHTVDTLVLEELLLSDVEHANSTVNEESLPAGAATSNDTATQEAIITQREIQASPRNERKRQNLALLELFVDRVALDDHPAFTLADRLATQLRALYSAYSRMQQMQPWQLSLQRLDDFFSRSTDKLAAGLRETNDKGNSELSARQTIDEINQLLVNLEALGQLHQQLQGKANELRDAGTRAGSVVPLHIKRRQRAQPINLSRVEAILELMEAGGDTQQQNDDDKQKETIHQLFEHLSTITSTSAQELQTILQLEVAGNEIQPNDISFWTPRFYVALRVNGKIACMTKIRPWCRGEIRFSERLRFTLPFFPDLVCAEVYERRIVMRDELLSTNAIPVVVPGQNMSLHRSSGSSVSTFENWGAADPGRLVPAASLAPSDEWYQFSSTTAIARIRWHQSFHNSLLFTHATRRTQGRLHLRASWIEDADMRPNHPSTGDTAYLPRRRPEIAGGLQHFSSPVQLIGTSPKRDAANLSLYLCDSSFSSERDFLRLVEPQQLRLDPNDPENVAVRRLQVYYTKQQLEEKAVALGHRKLFRSSEVSCCLSTSGRGLTKRNRLLRLRDREHVVRHGTSFCKALASQESGKVEPSRWNPQHAVFDEPLPMLDHELLADERLLRLLRPELHAFDRRLLSEEADRADASVIDRHRLRQLLKLQDFRERVRQTQIVNSNNTDSAVQDARSGRTKPLGSIVQEKPLPLFPGVFELPALGALFAPRRRLRPRTKTPAVVSSLQTAAHWPTACTLYIQVQKATNVPVRIKPPQNVAEADEIATMGRRRRDTLQRTKKSPRTTSLVSGRNDDETENTLETPRLGSVVEYESHVFVQVSFQGKTRQTSCATIMGNSSKNDHGGGAHPMWMETLSLPFRPPRDDWSPEVIESTQDIIRFSLFDQVTRPASAAAIDEDRQEGKERLGAQTRSLHRENCFLGSLEVPFLTLYRSGRLEGSLRCEMPVEHLGYVNLQIGARNGSSSTSNTSAAPPSVAFSNGEAGSTRQRHSQGVSQSSPTKKRMSMSPRKPSSPRSPEASEIDDFDNDELDDLGVVQSAREATYLKLTLQLDPVLPVLNQPVDNEQKGLFAGPPNAQDKLLVAHAQRWSAAATSSTPANAVRHRNFNVFVRNLSHGATFLPRFLRPQQPPKELLSTLLPALIRYVSLIPFLDDWLAFDGAKDVWSTSQEFLNMGAGDHEEHAVLLANLFLWYDRHHNEHGEQQRDGSSYIVLGSAIPEGNVVYVLRRGVLWNASTGVGYTISDPHCPLRDVSLAVSSKNVFANVQPLALSSGIRIGSCHELNWKIENNPKCWKPFFIAKDISMPPSVQHRELTYSVTPPEFVDQVERELREALKLAVRRWRSTHFATNFNELAGLQLREHLVALEREASRQNESQESLAGTSSTDKNAQLSPRSAKKLKQKLKLKLKLPMQRSHPGSSVLRELQRTREVCGLPLHVSFTDIPRVLEIVETTNIHYNERPGVEFALAVYVCAHPNCVLSVWVYLAALVPL